MTCENCSNWCWGGNRSKMTSHFSCSTLKVTIGIVWPPCQWLPPLWQTEHPFKSKKMVWHKLLSKQRRRAVVACFRMTPLYNIPRLVKHIKVTSGVLKKQLFQMFQSANTSCLWFCFFALQAPSFKHVPGGIQTQLASLGGLLVWRQDDKWLICECYLTSVWSWIVFFFSLTLFALPLLVHPRKRWSKKKEMKRKKEKRSQIPSTSLFCISVVLLLQKRGWIDHRFHLTEMLECGLNTGW